MLTTFVPPNVLQIGIVEKLDPNLGSLARRSRRSSGSGVKGGLAAVDVKRRKRRVRLERSDETLISVGDGEWVRFEKSCRTECKLSFCQARCDKSSDGRSGDVAGTSRS
jgi:hypothetical protein